MTSAGLGKLNLDGILFSSEPISDEDCTFPTPKLFEEKILCHLNDQIKNFKVTPELRREIQIFYGRMKIRAEQIETYREARAFYGDLRRLCKTDNYKEILIRFNNLSEENKMNVYDRCENMDLVILLKTGKNISNYTPKEISKALKPNFPSLSFKRLPFLLEDRVTRYAIVEEIDKFLIKASALYGTKLSLFNKDYVSDQSGKDQAIVRAGDRFHGPGVGLIRFIDSFLNLDSLLDIPTTYIDITSNKTSITAK